MAAFKILGELPLVLIAKIVSPSLPTPSIYFEKILNEHPLLASPYMALGWIHYKNQNPDLAIEYFLKAISLDPDFALKPKFVELIAKERFGWQVYNSLGWTYFQNGKINKAMAMFKKSLKMSIFDIFERKIEIF